MTMTGRRTILLTIIVIRLLSRIRERVSSQRWGGEPRGIDLAGRCR